MTVASPETDTAPPVEFTPPVPDGPAAPVVIQPVQDPAAAAAAALAQQQQIAVAAQGTLPGGLPAFEGAGVAVSQIVTMGATEVEHYGETLGMEDRLRLVGEFRVSKVTFEVDKNGDLVRKQFVKSVAPMMITPWDPSDPTDQGIVRARPRP